MNTKNINRFLKKVHKNFVESIKDEEVRKLVDKNSIISGGCIASMLQREKINDFDYYFTDLETTKAVATYYVKRFNETHPDNKIKPEVQIVPDEQTMKDRIKIMIKSSGIVDDKKDDKNYEYFELNEDQDEAVNYVEERIATADEIDSEKVDKSKPKYEPIFVTANAISLSGKIQLVTRFYGDPEEIHANFDFVHCTNYWSSKEGKLFLNEKALETLLTKELKYVGSKYPLCSVIRTRKFIKRGWSINAGQYLKMCFQLSELELSNVNVLEDQLTGVDAAYFYKVIQNCKKKQEEDKLITGNTNFNIDSTYLVSIIDRIF